MLSLCNKITVKIANILKLVNLFAILFKFVVFLLASFNFVLSLFGVSLSKIVTLFSSARAHLRIGKGTHEES